MTHLTPFFSLVLLCGGAGKRMLQSTPKQYLHLNQKPIALHSLETFLTFPNLTHVVVVCEKPYESIFIETLTNACVPFDFARPGIRRQDSVFNGIHYLKNNPLVCIHDSARPLVNKNSITELLLAGSLFEAATLGVKVKSTIKRCDNEQMVKETPARDFLWEIQTPQVIRLHLLQEGFNHAHANNLTVSDDVSLLELIDKPVKVVEGSYDNIKITTPEDLNFAEYTLNKSDLLQTQNCL